MILPLTMKPLTMYRNADFVSAWTFTTPTGPLDLTAIAFVLQVRVQPGQTGTPALLMTNGPPANGMTTFATGVMELSVPAAAVAAMPTAGNPLLPDLFFFDLVGTPSGGARQVYAAGTVQVFQGVSR